MPSLKLEIDTLHVQSFAVEMEHDADEVAPEMATANTCYRTCGVTHCFC